MGRLTSDLVISDLVTLTSDLVNMTPPKSTPALDVMICTIHADGPARVAAMQLPVVDGVRYIVSWQMPEGEPLPVPEIPESLRRPDVIVSRVATRGLARNRNNALSLATAPVALIADDDLHYTAGGLRAVMRVFAENPDVDLAQFMFDYGESEHKYYPATVTPLGRRLPRGLYATSFEVAFRRDRIPMRFDERFGIGGTLYDTGEESIFLVDVRRAGFRCVFFPILIGSHPGDTTGTRAMLNPRVAAGQGAAIAAEYGLAGLPRLPLFAWRRARLGQTRFLWALRHLLRGFLRHLLSPRR